MDALDGRVRIAVLSNGDAGQQREKVHRLGLDRYAETVLTSDELGAAKPDPRAFETACRRLGVPPADTACVGDRLDVDARGAADAGLHGIWLDRLGSHHPPPGIVAITSLEELPTLLVRCPAG